MFHNDFLESLALYEIIWKNIVESGRLQMTMLGCSLLGILKEMRCRGAENS
jgi:hypothetical protein